MANSVSPTAGGSWARSGASSALGLHAGTGDTERGAAVTLLAAGAVLRGRQPGRGHDAPGPARTGSASRAARRRAAAQRARRRSPPAWPRARATSAAPRPGERARRHRRAQVPVRDLAADVDPAVPELLLPGQRAGGRGVTTPCWSTLSAVGYGCAALVRPAGHPAAVQARPGSRCCWPSARWSTGASGATFSQVAFLVSGSAGLGRRRAWRSARPRSSSRRSTTSYRGRVFSFYDMLFNVTFVARRGAVSAAFMPLNGQVAADHLARGRGRLPGRRGRVPAAQPVSRRPAGSRPSPGAAAARRPPPSAAAPESPARGRAGRAPAAARAGARRPGRPAGPARCRAAAMISWPSRSGRMLASSSCSASSAIRSSRLS